eukprot:TRINITY_DN1979_c0_g1_i1.p1 TRINITY_DN1979_c0_g1~~TRINITY_DN1979_c0_g1_i1.p1  ORF type:complete len:338 (+),score=105.40 TRINITY_DN1979_c0_g1_i1:50-1063(+)
MNDLQLLSEYLDPSFKVQEDENHLLFCNYTNFGSSLQTLKELLNLNDFDDSKLNFINPNQFDLINIINLMYDMLMMINKKTEKIDTLEEDFHIYNSNINILKQSNEELKKTISNKEKELFKTKLQFEQLKKDFIQTQEIFNVKEKNFLKELQTLKFKTKQYIHDLKRKDLDNEKLKNRIRSFTAKNSNLNVDTYFEVEPIICNIDTQQFKGYAYRSFEENIHDMYNLKIEQLLAENDGLRTRLKNFRQNLRKIVINSEEDKLSDRSNSLNDLPLELNHGLKVDVDRDFNCIVENEKNISNFHRLNSIIEDLKDQNINPMIIMNLENILNDIFKKNSL